MSVRLAPIIDAPQAPQLRQSSALLYSPVQPQRRELKRGAYGVKVARTYMYGDRVKNRTGDGDGKRTVLILGCDDRRRRRRRVRRQRVIGNNADPRQQFCARSCIMISPLAPHIPRASSFSRLPGSSFPCMRPRITGGLPKLRDSEPMYPPGHRPNTSLGMSN